MFVQLNGISKNFGSTKVLQNVDFSIPKGCFCTLLGASGCGKSTLLRILAGIISADNGTVVIGERDVTNVESRFREIGMVFQSYALFPNMTAAQNIAFGLEMKKTPKDKIQQRVQEMIRLVQLEGKENCYPRELSGGQQQRVALARSLVTQPKVLLLDEPLSALDAKIRKNLRLQLRKIQRELGITTIMVTHDQEEAMVISDYVFIMSDGKIVQHGTPTEIYTKPNSTFVANFIGNYNIIPSDILKKIIPSLDAFEATAFAIRPEIFHEYPFEGCLSIHATIKDMIMMGTVLQWTLTLNNFDFHWHSLHQSNGSDLVGSEKTLYIHPKDIVPLS